MAATAIAFVAATAANWILGRLLTFRYMKKQSLMKEAVSIYCVSIIGLLLNLLIMYVAIDHIRMNQMLAKMMATGIVFIWNFGMRKLVIYKDIFD
jgi:putative flippase GtrA